MNNTNLNNFALNTDSYKLSMHKQYPPGTKRVSSYGVARDPSTYPLMVMAGMQPYVMNTLMNPMTMRDVDEAAAIAQLHGEPFEYAGFETIVKEHNGFAPIEICALQEGVVVPTGTALYQTVSTDERLPWLTTHTETGCLRAVWYMSTVATQSWSIKQLLRRFLEQTADEVEEQLLFKLHDFGARGCSSLETAGLGGLAHLYNFRGTDTLAALLTARKYYDEPIAGFSIPAAEHSTITAWRRAGELDAFRNMLTHFGVKGGVFAVVSDSYDIEHAVRQYWGKDLRDAVVASGSTLVVRPDSQDPVVLVPRIVQQLALDYGFTTNAKGFKVLNPSVRVIQGDGINELAIRGILGALMALGFSAENVAFGMGGALLQGVNRDTLGFAMKASAIENAEGWYDVYKDPVNASSKRSTPGRMAVVVRDGVYKNIRLEELKPKEKNHLELVYRNGFMYRKQTLAGVRANTDKF